MMLIKSVWPIVGLWIRFLFSLSLFVACSTQAESRLSINTGFKAPVSDIYRLIIEDLFERAGLLVDFREVSAERSLTLANDGVDDGDCCRILEITSTYKDLVRVPVPVIEIDFVSFFKGASLKLAGTGYWQALKPFEVGVVSGWKILEFGLQKHPPRKLYTLSSPKSLFEMLERDRIQVATIGRLVGYRAILDMQLTGLHVAEPPLVSRPLYLYLNKRHVDLVPQLTRQLQAMQDEGVLARYYRDIVKPLENELTQLGQ